MSDPGACVFQHPLFGQAPQALLYRKRQLPLWRSYVAPRYSSTLPKHSPAACQMERAAAHDGKFSH
ncbi:MAG: hypothetical protein PHP75_04025 [Methylacidiphilaceae bacterium]|nr:hypothetical protein [Candidatus Methylacidiphilaceae bacterium]